MPGNVILVGFMGAGKSVVGRLLARRLGRCFVETDDMITAREGRSIPEIFAEQGEARFRQLEAEAVELLRLKSDDVIATGGGLPCREGRMDALRALGTVVWLQGDVAALAERARQIGNRPMLAGRSADEMEALYRTREPFYRQAHLTVDTTALGVDQAVAHLLTALRGEDFDMGGSGRPPSPPGGALSLGAPMLSRGAPRHADSFTGPDSPVGNE